MNELFIYACVGVSVTFFVWLLVSLYNRFDFSRFTPTEDQYFEEAPFVLRLLLPYAHAAGVFLISIIGENNKYVDRYKTRINTMLMSAGEPAGLDAEVYTGLFVVGTMLGFLCGAGIYVMVGRWGGALFAGCAVLGFVLPYIWLTDRVKSRQLHIRRGLPYCLDLVTLAVEAGMDFTTALGIVADKMSVPALTTELKRTLRAIQMGRNRSDALRDFAGRVNISELSSVTAAIIQADELGANLGPILRIQSEQLRQRRSQRAEKLAMEASVKILLPLIAFLFPTTLVVIFGPLLAAYLSRSFG